MTITQKNQLLKILATSYHRISPTKLYSDSIPEHTITNLSRWWISQSPHYGFTRRVKTDTMQIFDLVRDHLSGEASYSDMSEIALKMMTADVCKCIMCTLYMFENIGKSEYIEMAYNNNPIKINNIVDWREHVDKKSLNAINKHLESELNASHDAAYPLIKENDKYYKRIEKFKMSFDNSIFGKKFNTKNNLLDTSDVLEYVNNYRLNDVLIEYPIVFTNKMGIDLVYVDNNIDYFIRILVIATSKFWYNIMSHIMSPTDVYYRYNPFKPEFVYRILYNFKVLGLSIYTGLNMGKNNVIKYSELWDNIDINSNDKMSIMYPMYQTTLHMNNLVRMLK